jgi:hypothetical protein
MSHEPGSLEAIVQNIVKNWEIEASFKSSLTHWRTVDPDKYTFLMNGGEPQPAEHMLKVGTYNAILTESNFYSPANNDFESSHKTFQRMMPTFAWEVLEVYSGPPKVAFKWRHWGVMKNDYVGYNEYVEPRHLCMFREGFSANSWLLPNSKKQKVRVKAHGGPIDIQEVTVATVNSGLKVEKLETWFDPLAMFKQVSTDGEVLIDEDSA